MQRAVYRREALEPLARSAREASNSPNNWFFFFQASAGFLLSLRKVDGRGGVVLQQLPTGAAPMRDEGVGADRRAHRRLSVSLLAQDTDQHL